MAGSLRSRGPHSWELRVHAGRDGSTGRKRYVTRTVRGGKREAERALAKLVTEVERGGALAKVGTVGELCERWFESAAPNLSPTVVAEYRRLLDQHIIPTFGRVSLRRLRTADLDAWYARLRRSGGVKGRPLAPNSVQRIHAVLRRALNQGMRWGWISVNPAASASPPRVLRKPMTIPAPQSIAALIEASAKVNPGLPVFLRLAAVSGARRGELCALRWRHIEFEARSLHIEGSLVEVGGTLIEKDTKTHAERRISLDDRTLEVLAAHRMKLQSLLETARTTLSAEAFVFSHDPEGAHPWRPNYTTLAFGRLARQRGLAGLRLHDLRHFAATTMLANGVDVRTTASRLGHAQTSTTLDVYAHFVKAADQRAAGAVATALDG